MEEKINLIEEARNPSYHAEDWDWDPSTPPPKRTKTNEEEFMWIDSDGKPVFPTNKNLFDFLSAEEQDKIGIDEADTLGKLVVCYEEQLKHIKLCTRFLVTKLHQDLCHRLQKTYKTNRRRTKKRSSLWYPDRNTFKRHI